MKRKNSRLIICILSICVFLGCILYIADFYYQGYAYQKRNQSISAIIKEEANNSGQFRQLEDTKEADANLSEEDNSSNISESSLKSGRILPEFTEVYEKNSDFIGWLTIADTIIDYPVMQGDDNKYYLDHDFYGEETKHGSLFLDYKNDVLSPNSNLIIYGHNMKDGTMFSALRKYKDQSFYEDHKVISFHTIYEKAQYEIVSVFLSKVYLKDEDTFKYYQFIQASNQEEFNEFYKNIKELSLYDTGNEAQYGDTFLTLSTCDYTTKDGRLAVVAKKLKDEE